MALAPIDYSGAFQAPGAGQLVNSVNQGVATGTNILQNDQLIAQTNLMKAMQADTAAVAKNPTPDALATLSIKYPQLSQQFKNSYDMLKSNEQQDRLNQAIPIYAAIQGGNNATAADLLNKQAEAFQNAGRQQDAAQARAMAQFVQDHPEQAKYTMGIMLAGAMGPEKFTDTFKSVGGERRAEELQPATVQKTGGEAAKAVAEGAAAPQKQALESGNLASQIEERAGKLSLDKERLKADIALKSQHLDIERLRATYPEAIVKNINSAVQQSATAGITADKFEDIANKFEQISPGSGVGARVSEAWKDFFGGQNGITALRQEYARLRNLGLSSLLPKSAEGTPFAPRSTSELNIFMKGLPDETANPQAIAAFARSMATVSRVEQMTNDVKAQWQSSNRTLGRAVQDMDINGIKVAKGTTYQEFEKQYLKSHMSDIYQQRANNTFQSRSYSRFANPQENGAQ